MADTIISAASFLGSEVGRVTKPVSTYLGDTRYDSTGVVGNVIKAGTMFVDTNVKGLVYTDVDLTGTSATNQVEISVMTAGRFVNHASVLPKVVGTDTKLTLTVAQSQGLFVEASGLGAITRPY